MSFKGLIELLGRGVRFRRSRSSPYIGLRANPNTDPAGDIYFSLPIELPPSGTQFLITDSNGNMGISPSSGDGSGTAGTNGKTILSGSGVPSSGLGTDGDFYLDTATSRLYGAKTSGVWGGGVSLIGATGAQGIQGIQGVAGNTGSAGADGKTILSGSGAPSSGLGTNGDFYLDTSVSRLYGAKTSGAWGSGVSLIGATGATGAQGATGASGTGGGGITQAQAAGLAIALG